MDMNKYDKKYNTCPACDSDKIALYHSDFRGNAFYWCSTCDVQFMNPVYSDATLDEFYANYTFDATAYEDITEKQLFVIHDNFKAIDNVVKTHGKLLDFGIGNGSHTVVARDKGWDVTGYDVDCIATERVKKKLGVDVKCGDFFDIDWGNTKFDMLYINQVMEHIKNPVKHLIHFRKILNDNGYLFITVPNIRATNTRIKFFLEKIGLRKKNVGKYYDSDHHVFYYHPGSLAKLLTSNGYTIIHTHNCIKPKTDKSKFVQFVSNNILENFYSTSTFMIIARKV